MDLALILLAGGAVVIAWIYVWSRQQARRALSVDLEQVALEVPVASGSDALLVARDEGRLIYVNGSARRWLDLNGGTPNLEHIARLAEPSDNFLALFAEERQTSFQFGKRWVEASSHRIPAGTETRTVVVMRELAASAHNPDVLDLGLAMRLINEIGEAVHAGMSVEQVLQVLLTIIGQAMPFEAGEVCLWDEKTGALYPRGWVGDAFYVVALAEAGGRYEMDEGVTGWIARHRQPVLLNSHEDFAAVQPKLLDSGYQSIAAVPLMLGERFIGTLEIASKEAHYYTPGHQALLQAISTPVAVAIHNAELYTEQVQRLDGLAKLHQVVSDEDVTGTESRPVYETLTARIAELADADMCGILLYDRDRGGLVPQLPFYGLPEALVMRLFIPLPEDSPQRDIWDGQSYWVSDDVSDEPLVEALGLRHIIDVAGIVNTAWIPLQVGQGRIGVVAISNRRTPGGFNNRDIQNMVVLASQAAVVVEGVRLYQREQRMDTELVGLQEITNAIGALSHEAEFYGEITERIARLMDMEICGILLYEAETERLVSKLPFYGVNDELAAAYAVPLPSGSIMAELWNDEPYWFSNRVAADSLVFEAGLDEIAGQMGVSKTLMVVLQASGRKLGAVQVANKRSGQDFNDGDARLLMIFATQAAAIIENARLFQAAQRSAEQAQGLRRVAELAGNVLTADQPFTPVLAEIAALMDVEVVYINVLDQPQGAVITYPRWVYGFELSEPIVQDIFTPGFEYSVVVSHRPYLGNDVQSDPNILENYREIAGSLGLRDGILVPLIYTDRTLGEMGIANRRGRPFDQSDLDIMKAIASQIAAALDRLLLYEETGQNLSRRLEELDAISRVSNELTVTLDLDQILDAICVESVATLRAQAATVALFHPRETWSAPNRPEVERRLGAADLDMPLLADVEREAVDRGQEAVVVQDYEFSLFKPAPPGAASALAVTIQYLDEPVGVIHLFHDEASVFDERAATFIEAMAVKASLAFGNAIRYREQLERGERLRRRVEQLNSIFELGHLFQSTASPVDVLEAIAYSVQDSVGFDTVLMLLVDDEAGCLRRTAHAGLPVNQFEASRDDTISQGHLKLFLSDSYQISESYFFPAEQADDWRIDGIHALSMAFAGSRTLADAGGDNWRDGDLFVVTMRSTGGDLIGLMCLDRPYNNRRPDRGTVEVLEIFAHQAARTIENMRLYRSTVRSAELEAQLNEVMEAVSSTLDIAEIVREVANNVQRIVPFNRLTISVRDAEDTGFDVLRVVIAEDGALDVLRDRRETLGQSAVARTYDDRQDYLYHAGDAAASLYEDLRAWVASGEQTSLVLPLLTGGECLGTVHMGSHLPDETRFTAYRALLRRMAQLVAGAVQNARLFTQAINLQVLNESVVESIQQAIIVLDDSGHLILSNSYMQERFDWPPHSAGQHLFDYRPELRAIIGDDLAAVLDSGTPRERINQTLTPPHADDPLVMSFYLYPLRATGTVRGAVMLVEDVTERALLEQAMQARAEQLATLTDLSNRITSSLERDEVIQMALTRMADLIDHDGMTLWRRHGSSMVLQGATGDLIAGDAPAEYAFTFGEYPLIRQMIDSQRALALNDPAQIVHEMPLHVGGQSWLGVPLVSQFHAVGMIMLSHRQPGAYENPSDHHVSFAFASQVAIALANADLFEQTFDRTNELSTLLEAAQATSLTTDLNTVLRNVVDLMFGALSVEACSIMIWDEVDNALEVQLERIMGDDPTQVLPRGTRHDLANYPARLQALRERDVVVIIDNDEQNPYPRERAEMSERGYNVRMLVPLVVRDASIGLLQLEQTSEDRIVTQQKVRLARALGAQVAVAIENARLSAETASHFEESLIINDLSRAISSTLDLNDMIAIVRAQVPAVAGASELYLALYEAETQAITFPLVVKAGQSVEMSPRVLGDDEVSYIIKQRRPLNLGADYYSPDELRRSLGIVNGEGDARSYLGVPLIAGDEVHGVLAVRDTERTRAFSINEQRILTTVGSQLGAAIQNARLFRRISTFAEDLNRQVAERTRELEQERDHIDLLYQITSELARTLDMERLMPRALGMVAKAVSAQDGVIMQFEPFTDQLYTRAVINPTSLQKTADGSRDYHPAETLARWIIDQEEPVILVSDLHEADFWDVDAPGAVDWRSALAVLLETNEELHGVMVFLSQQPNAFMESHLGLMVAAANQVASAFNNAELYKMIRDQAERLGALLRNEQEEAEKNKAILEGIGDGVILINDEGRLILFNAAAERIFQAPRQDVLDATLDSLVESGDAGTATWASALLNRIAMLDRDDPDAVTAQRLELDNQQIVSIHLSPVHTAERYLGAVAVLRDITREVEADRSKSQFVSNVSHEFRTPLTPIKGYTDLLLMGAAGELSEMQKSTLQTIRDNVLRLTTLVEDVLNISQIDSGREQLNLTAVNLNDLVQDSLDNLLSRAPHQRKALQIRFSPPPDLPLVPLDAHKMTRAVSNVIDNAFNYTPTGGTIDIDVKPDASGRLMLLTVRDSGVGIPEDFRDRIWRRFERHDETALALDVAGTGLGLPIVRELVEMHGGQVWFESEVGEGTTFFITIPLRQPGFVPVAAEQGSQSGAS